MQRIVLQTNLARDKAEALLQGLIELRAETAHKLPGVPVGSDGTASSGSPLDRAIETARRVICQLNRAMEMAELGLNDEACETLDETLDALTALPKLGTREASA
ncbi:MAG: hypothetical protein CMJ49_04225 [Planctomycetaceae bacterium]|nr:hypothetical protein [Planctomycetaceae bacterium]